MSHQEENKLYFEQIGDDFDNWISLYDTNRRIQLIKSYLPKKSQMMSCLEVGCGTGMISKSIKPLVGILTVVDISEKLAVRVAKEINTNGFQQDACKLTIENDSFDMIISSECIEHTVDPKQALKEMVRVLKPGGMLIVTSPNKMWYPVLWLSNVTQLRKFNGNENWLFPWEAQSVLNKVGLKNTSIGACHLFPWQIPFAKKILPFFDKFHEVLFPLMINYAIVGHKKK